MNKLLYSLSALAALTISIESASAQSPPPRPVGPPPAYNPNLEAGYPPGYGQMMYGGPAYDGYMGGGGKGHGFGGLSHGGLLSGLFTNHGHKFDKRKGLLNDQRDATTLPVATGGTLVFPQNPFVRSPRDYFMYDER